MRLKLLSKEKKTPVKKYEVLNSFLKNRQAP